jgi:hypothetical protein
VLYRNYQQQVSILPGINLFNTPYGTDLFSNETELITDLNNLGDITTGVLFQINAKLANYGDVAIYTDTSGDVMY